MSDYTPTDDEIKASIAALPKMIVSARYMVFFVDNTNILRYNISRTILF
ncbi:MAG: hypothetical protein IJ740_00040 [Ruminococcus sp.]|nr:hypothetical protein [Ruminococcus sp.]